MCRQSHSYKITLQFCLWDFLRDLGETRVGGAEVVKNLGDINDDSDDEERAKKISLARMRNVAKLYACDPRKAEKGGFVEMLRDLMLDPNATVVSNAVAALTEIGDRQDGVIFKLNLATVHKLLAAMPECSEWVEAT